MATARDIVEGSLRLIGVVGQAEQTPDADAGYGLLALQDMLAVWSADDIIIPSITQDSFTLVAGTASYTYGTGGTFTGSTRPESIVEAFLRSGTEDYPLSAMTDTEYRDIPNKSNTGLPTRYWYNPSYPTGTFYFDVKPDAAYTLKVDVLRGLSQPTSLNGSISFPDQYRAALKFNLAIWLAPEYERPVSNEVALLARTTLSTLKAANWRPIQLRCDPALVGPSRSDINAG